MSVRTWPGYAIAAFRWHKANQSSVFKSMFGSQSLEASTPLWEVSMSGVSEARAAARQIEAYIDSLNGFTDQIEIWNVEHPAPTGTMRGVMTLAADAAQGATSLQLVTSYGTNLLAFPEAFDNAVWLKNNLSVTVNAGVAPDGTNTAYEVKTTNPADVYLMQAAVYTGDSVHSIYVKYGGSTPAQFCEIRPITFGSAINDDRVYFDFSTKVFTGASLVCGYEELPLGWFRIFVKKGQIAGQVNGEFRVCPGGMNPVLNETMLIWGAKLETGALTDYGFGKTLLTGDLLGLGSGLTQQVVPVSADAISTGQGNITVSVGIPLRNAFSLGAAVTWDKPKALFRQKTLFDGMQYKPDGADAWSLSLREDWRL